MNKDLKQFLDWLKENDRTEEEKMQCKLLDEYMKTRDNLPGKGVTGSELVSDPKSSDEIAEDLRPMVLYGHQHHHPVHVHARVRHHHRRGRYGEMGHLARHGLPSLGDIFFNHNP